uniref:Uncharacterized protein n=1 Tax=uncultured marine thaumarchaeote KM3_31_G08 TaxID=1456121 RepID=A0A075H0H0_9ARCH|nr:hypothetical protein [uncultured marine thaumarchaeote KM3_31_G08]
MTQKNILMILPIMLSILLIPNIGISFAEHGHDESSGSGCSGDCTAPTLGADIEGFTQVEGGFTINGQTFDVEYFEQTIPTQIIHTNEPVEIILKVFENSGPQFLNHVGLVIGNEHVFNSYVWEQLPTAEIEWTQTFDGDQSVEIEDSENLLTDVSVDAEVDGTITVLKFQFTPTTPFDTSHIMVKMWDHNRSYWVNNFQNGLEIKSNPFSGGFAGTLLTESDTYGETSEVHEISSETHQDEIHEDKHDSHDTKSTEDIHCDENSKAILDSRFGNTICAPINIATALVEAGLATLI